MEIRSEEHPPQRVHDFFRGQASPNPPVLSQYGAGGYGAVNESRHQRRVGENDCIDGMLPKKSIVKPGKLFTVHSTLVLKKVCALREAKLEMRHFVS